MGMKDNSRKSIVWLFLKYNLKTFNQIIVSAHSFEKKNYKE